MSDFLKDVLQQEAEEALARIEADPELRNKKMPPELKARIWKRIEESLNERED